MPITRWSRRPLLLALGLLSLLPGVAHADDLTVFAAASLTDALRDIAAQWEPAGQPKPRFNFAASSTLARQIEQGASANVFASADEQWMDYLTSRDLIVPGTRRDLLGNALVLVVPKDRARTVQIGPGFDLLALLGPDGRLATGDPANVPAGIYARQALSKLGMWEAVEPRLARADSVRSALLLVEHGEAPAGIVYATDAAVSSEVAVAGRFPEDSHFPISYPFALVRGGDTPAARSFLAFLSTAAARDIFRARGFTTE